MMSIVIPDSGHFVPEEQPEALAKALKAFLGGAAQPERCR